MPADLTVLVPRKDTTDEYRNLVQAACTRHTAPVATGTDQSGRDLWSFSRSVNDARRQAHTTKLLIAPGDYLLTQAHIAATSAALDERPWWGPFHSVHQLDQASTNLVLGGATPHPDMPGLLLGFCVPCIAVRADVFDDVGGMDPRFEGWGPEDAALRLKLHALYGDPEAPTSTVYELAAPRFGTPNRAQNTQLYVDRYVPASTPETMRALIAEQNG